VARLLDVARRNGVVDRTPQAVLDVAVLAATHPHDRALARADDAGDDRHVVADHVMEEERLVGLIDERSDVADIDRLPDVEHLAARPQAIEEFTEVLFH
jgi:hypothetical protein